jgi:CheY-like chemotaxis protein
MNSGEKNSEKKRILFLEDSNIFAEMTVEFISGEGYEVSRVENGFEGLKMVYSFLPHLIITDVEMPVFKGYQVAMLLKSRKNTRNIPIIMFTSLGETRDRFWGLDAGTDRYVEKSPDNFSGLRAAAAPVISNALAIREMEELQRKTRTAFARYVPKNVSCAIFPQKIFLWTYDKTQKKV